MNKIFIICTFSLTLLACSANQTLTNEKEKRPEDKGEYSGVEGAIQKQKDQAYLINQANKVKCQDARLDLVDAEAEGDINMIRRVKARLQKLCVIEE
jgi:hypothetical protein